jgi:hypothetical protein
LNYARQSLVGTTSNWSSTNSIGGTDATSGGTGGTTSNNLVIQWTAATWTATVVGVVITDSVTTLAGNVLFWGTLTTNKVVNSGDTFQFAANQLSCQIDN